MKQLLPVLFFLPGLTINAQFPNPADFNTATNALNTGTLTLGQNDLHWTASSTGSLGPFVPAVSAAHPFQLANGWHNTTVQNANWISYPHNCSSSDPSEHSCNYPNHENIFYKLIVTLPSTLCPQSLAPGAYCMKLNMFADNCVYQVFLNGTSQYLSTSSNPYYDFDYNTSNMKTVVLCNNWTAGSNTLIVHVKSGAVSSLTWEGFYADVSHTVGVNAGLSAVTQVTNSCAGSNTGAASINVQPGGSYSYTWLPGGGNLSVANNLSPGNYTVVAMSGSCSISKTVSVSQIPSPTISVTPLPDVLCAGNAITYTASGAKSYVWQPGNQSGSVVTVSPPVTTSYTVTGTNTLGCSSSTVFTQNVSVCNGIQKKSPTESLSVFPNPGEGKFIIKGLSAGGELQVYNSVGVKIRSFYIDGRELEVDLGGIPKGIYLISYSLKGETSTTRLLLN